MDDKRQPSFTTANTKQSKTDPFRKGVRIVVSHAVDNFVHLLQFSHIWR